MVDMSAFCLFDKVGVTNTNLIKPTQHFSSIVWKNIHFEDIQFLIFKWTHVDITGESSSDAVVGYIWQKRLGANNIFIFT